MELPPQCLHDRRVGIIYDWEFKSAEMGSCKWKNFRIMFLNTSDFYVKSNKFPNGQKHEARL